MKFTTLITVMWVSMLTFSSITVAQQTPDTSIYQTTVNQYCVTCHNDTLNTAGLSLQELDQNSIGENAEVWEKVLRKLKARSMPPAGMPRPDERTYESFANYLRTELDSYVFANPQPGEPSSRRLNKKEYLNAVRDLLAVDIQDDTILPDDDTMFGFDNIGDVLTLSPVLAEQYISAARKVRRQTLGDPNAMPEYQIYTVNPSLKQHERVDDELPFGTRGGIAVNHHFPQDGEYDIQVRLQLNTRDYIRGLTEPHQFEIRLDGKVILQTSIGGEKYGRSSGLFSTSAVGDLAQEQYERNADDILRVRFSAKSGTGKITAAFIKERYVPEEPLYPEHTHYTFAQFKGGLPGVFTVTIGGPFNASGIGVTESRERILTCRPSNQNDESCANQILSNLAHKGFRRPATELEMEELLEFYRRGLEDGFEAGIGLALERILAGPEFLFVTEKVPANTAEGAIYRLSDPEIATKLALFLWSSLPDAELLTVAEAGKLSDSKMLEQQIHRMLEDLRSRALIENFAAQWLTLGGLNVAKPNINVFPYFGDNLRNAFRQETELFFDYVFSNDRPLMELLDADYTFVNERLAKHYGIPDVYGNHFRKVSLPDNTRGGLLGQGSILMVTSYANRTAPTIRGKWVLENLLGAPPPPPPADVPGLREKNDEGRVLNMRQQMELHRANPVCASCHKIMDPLGFALENYDAIGKWRTVDGNSGVPIDATGELPDGTSFNGPVGLRQVLSEKRREDFILTFIEKILTYGLGRGVDHRDAPIMRSIMDQTAEDEHRLSSIIKAIVESTPFQMRRVASHGDI